jgi:phytoene dehydrogenase-like protein
VKPGGAVFKLDYALSGPMPWRAAECHRAGTVHIGPSLDEIGAALSAVAAGRAPERPFLIVSQPSLFDPTRAPAGHHVLWVYGHVPYRWGGDLTQAVEAQLERFAPGWRDLVLARHITDPAGSEAHNANNVGGDISNGAFGGLHAVFRPLVTTSPYATPDSSVWLCSSATPPGPGVHGMCGHHAALAVLKHRFGSVHPPTVGSGSAQHRGEPAA